METENQFTYPEDLKTLDYLFANDLKNLFSSIEDLSENLRGEKNVEILNRGIDQINSIARMAGNIIDPFLFESLELFLEKLDFN